jgi:hypothetical protein
MLCSALSFGLCIAAAVLWCRSYVCRDSIEHEPKSFHAGMNVSPSFISNNGQLTLARNWRWERYGVRVIVMRLPRSVVLRWQTSDSDYVLMRHPVIRGTFWQTSPNERWVLGVKFGRLADPTLSHGATWVTVPYAALVAASAVLPLAWLRAAVRRRKRAGAGRCPRCGYDLRASPDRCPECGTPAAK